MTRDLDAYLPAELRGPTTAITRIAAGLSGACVYRVDAAGNELVLKVSGEDEPLEVWRRKVQIQQLAATAGLAPRVIHADEQRRAVLSAFVVNRSFPMLFGNPATRDAAVILLGTLLRRVHDLPLPPGAEATDPLELVNSVWSMLAGFAVPAFVRGAVQRMLAEEPPARDRALVLSHNDVNPSNVIYDGEHLLLLDWDTAAPNDPLFDLAAISVFLKMDDATCLRLIAVHDDAPISALPARFTYCQRLVAVMCGTAFLHLAQRQGHPGGTPTFDEAPGVADIHQRIRAGTLNLASAEGQWSFGLALVKASGLPS
ncbi:hypothetical protein BH11MYX3_BH11MYX3_43280 [soil metagenome]